MTSYHHCDLVHDHEQRSHAMRGLLCGCRQTRRYHSGSPMTVPLGGAPGDSGVPGVLARRLSEGFWMAPTSMLSSEMLGERWTIAGARRDGGTFGREAVR